MRERDCGLEITEQVVQIPIRADINHRSRTQFTKDTFNGVGIDRAIFRCNNCGVDETRDFKGKGTWKSLRMKNRFVQDVTSQDVRPPIIPEAPKQSL